MRGRNNRLLFLLIVLEFYRFRPMILTRNDIRHLITTDKIAFDPPLDRYQDQPHAVDLRLGTTFYLPKIWQMTDKGREVLNVDVTESGDNNFEPLELKPGQYFEIAPGESVIGTSLEKIELKADDLMGVLYPRSSINRRGLSVDMTGIVDVHYSGNLMIPIHNKTHSQIIRVYPGERICQIVFHKLTNDIDREEGLRHGAVAAKYEGCDDKGLCLRQDAESELELIKSGDFQKLKELSY